MLFNGAVMCHIAILLSQDCLWAFRLEPSAVAYAIMSLASQPCTMAGPAANDSGDDVDKRSSKTAL